MLLAGLIAVKQEGVHDKRAGSSQAMMEVEGGGAVRYSSAEGRGCTKEKKKEKKMSRTRDMVYEW